MPDVAGSAAREAGSRTASGRTGVGAEDAPERSAACTGSAVGWAVAAAIDAADTPRVEAPGAEGPPEPTADTASNAAAAFPISTLSDRARAFSDRLAATAPREREVFCGGNGPKRTRSIRSERASRSVDRAAAVSIGAADVAIAEGRRPELIPDAAASSGAVQFLISAADAWPFRFFLRQRKRDQVWNARVLRSDRAKSSLEYFMPTASQRPRCILLELRC